MDCAYIRRENQNWEMTTTLLKQVVVECGGSIKKITDNAVFADVPGLAIDKLIEIGFVVIEGGEQVAKDEKQDGGE